jgi:hypothetical protein
VWREFGSCRICKSLLESYICDGSHAHVQAVLESGALFRMYCFCPHVLLKNVSVAVFCYTVVIMYYLSYKAGVCRRLVELSLNSDEKIVIPVVSTTSSHLSLHFTGVSVCVILSTSQMRAMVSISAGDALQTEMVVNCDILPRLAVLVRSTNTNIRANSFLV